MVCLRPRHLTAKRRLNAETDDQLLENVVDCRLYFLRCRIIRQCRWNGAEQRVELRTNEVDTPGGVAENFAKVVLEERLGIVYLRHGGEKPGGKVKLYMTSVRVRSVSQPRHRRRTVFELRNQLLGNRSGTLQKSPRAFTSNPRMLDAVS